MPKKADINLFLKPDEAFFLGSAVLRTLEEIQDAAKDPTKPWTPETRKLMREMLDAGKSLRTKLQRIGVNVDDLPEYFEGDENEFFTKES